MTEQTETETQHPTHTRDGVIVPQGFEVIEGIRPLYLEPGDIVLRVDRRVDGSLCCLTVLRRTP